MSYGGYEGEAEAVEPASKTTTHAEELDEFKQWQRSKMTPRQRKTEELREDYARCVAAGEELDFWNRIVSELLRGEKNLETVLSFKSVVGTFDALRHSLDDFHVKIQQAFEEDAAEEDVNDGEDQDR